MAITPHPDSPSPKNDPNEADFSLEGSLLDDLFADALAAGEKRNKKTKPKDTEVDIQLDGESLYDEEDGESFDLYIGEDEDLEEEEDGETLSKGPASALSGIDDEMEQLLAQVTLGHAELDDEDPDLAFPIDDAEDEDDDEDIVVTHIEEEEEEEKEVEAPSPSDVATLPKARLAAMLNQVEWLRRELKDNKRALALARQRETQLEDQVVQAARQVASAAREFENFRKRTRRERDEQTKFGGEQVLKDFLGVYDNLSRALEHAGDARETPLGEGVAMTLEQFVGALKSSGAAVVDSNPGTEFDPAFHEAVGQVPSEEIPQGAVVSEMQRGFILHDRLLRAAMVTVSSGKTTGKTEKTGKNETAEFSPETEAKPKEEAKTEPASQVESNEEKEASASVKATQKKSSKGKTKGQSKKKTKKKAKKKA